MRQLGVRSWRQPIGIGTMRRPFRPRYNGNGHNQDDDDDEVTFRGRWLDRLPRCLIVRQRWLRPGHRAPRCARRYRWRQGVGRPLLRFVRHRPQPRIARAIENVIRKKNAHGARKRGNAARVSASWTKLGTRRADSAMLKVAQPRRANRPVVLPNGPLPTAPALRGRRRVVRSVETPNGAEARPAVDGVMVRTRRPFVRFVFALVCRPYPARATEHTQAVSRGDNWCGMLTHRLLLHPFELVALTPAAGVDPSIAIAASAYGTGVLDLEYATGVGAAATAIRRLAWQARGPWGIKLSSSDDRFTAALLSQLPEGVSLVILTQHSDRVLRPLMARLRDAAPTARILIEATCAAEAEAAVRAAPDGVIAKGCESAGYVRDTTAFVLVQQLLSTTLLPLYVQGGVGLHTVAACRQAGAAGVILDSQLALTRESRLPAAAKAAVARMDGSETVCLAGESGECYRVFYRPGCAAVEAVRERIATGNKDGDSLSRGIRDFVGWGPQDRSVWLVGQDAALAAPLARAYRTTGGVLHAFLKAVDAHLRTARTVRPLDIGAPLAKAHGTRYPIVQGPMTRVSDAAGLPRRGRRRRASLSWPLR